MILADAHVHIYDCFDLEQFFDAALLNFQTEAKQQKEEIQNCLFFLLLTEGAQQNWFLRIAQEAVTEKISFGKWSVALTAEKICLLACHDLCPDVKIYLVAGRQIVTAEKLEVLALFTEQFYDDGSSLKNTVENVRENGSIPVIPWGAGKWFGKRGRILKRFLDLYHGNDLLLGDNGGRPSFWPTPPFFHFAKSKGIKILPGSDPLPFAPESKKPGGYGCSFKGAVNPLCPAKSIKKQIVDPEKNFTPYGRHETAFRFFRNQIAMQIVKRQSKRKHT